MQNYQPVTTEAAQIVFAGDRQQDYGNPVDSFNRIALVAQVLTGVPITPEICAKVMMAAKIVREGFKHKRDNLTDLCGYADILNYIHENNSHLKEAQSDLAEPQQAGVATAIDPELQNSGVPGAQAGRNPARARRN